MSGEPEIETTVLESLLAFVVIPLNSIATKQQHSNIQGFLLSLQRKTLAGSLQPVRGIEPVPALQISRSGDTRYVVLTGQRCTSWSWLRARHPGAPSAASKSATGWFKQPISQLMGNQQKPEAVVIAGQQTH